jgi:hypothetical protein
VFSLYPVFKERERERGREVRTGRCQRKLIAEVVIGLLVGILC